MRYLEILALVTSIIRDLLELLQLIAMCGFI
jgi:hypothetical protein